MRYTGNPAPPRRRRPLLTFETLPPADWSGRWTIGRKASLLKAIETGQITLEEAEQRYRLSSEELGLWREDQQAGGLKGLRVSRGDSRARRLGQAVEVSA